VANSVGWAARAGAGLVAMISLAVLILAAALKPDPAGHGTHRRLGLPPCGWVVALGKPCPTCGMTTAFAHAAQGRPGHALWAQPAGALMALLTAAGFWSAVHVAVFGSRVGSLLAKTLRARILWPGLGVLVASWVYKMIVWNEFQT